MLSYSVCQLAVLLFKPIYPFTLHIPASALVCLTLRCQRIYSVVTELQFGCFKCFFTISLPIGKWTTCVSVGQLQRLNGLKGAGYRQPASELMSWLIFPNVTCSVGEGLDSIAVLTKGL